LGDRGRLITFSTPTPEGVEYIGRNHVLVEGLARHILETALSSAKAQLLATRCGFTKTDAVEKRTTLLLVRSRYLLDSPKQQNLLAEECAVVGFTGSPANPVWLSPEQAMLLLETAKPTGDVIAGMKQTEIAEFLGRIEELQPALENFAIAHGELLLQSHRRVRAITKEGQIRVKPQLPMDILGVYILQPDGRKKL
jgi:hypothetical protein